MSRSRREFLKRGTFMALAAGVPLAFTKNAFGMNTATSKTSGLNFAAFKSQLGTNFFIDHQTARVKTTLVSVASFASRKQTAAGREGFSLLFRGPEDMPLQQDTYLIEHEELGLFSFLIVPVGIKGTQAQYYEAVINRLHS